MPGQRPTFKQLEEGQSTYDTDYDNFAPTRGLRLDAGRARGRSSAR